MQETSVAPMRIATIRRFVVLEVTLGPYTVGLGASSPRRTPSWRSRLLSPVARACDLRLSHTESRHQTQELTGLPSRRRRVAAARPDVHCTSTGGSMKRLARVLSVVPLASLVLLAVMPASATTPGKNGNRSVKMR